MPLTAAQKKAGKARIEMIQAEAKKIWNSNKKPKTYAEAIKKGSAILKKQGKL